MYYSMIVLIAIKLIIDVIVPVILIKQLRYFKIRQERAKK